MTLQNGDLVEMNDGRKVRARNVREASFNAPGGTVQGYRFRGDDPRTSLILGDFRCGGPGNQVRAITKPAKREAAVA